MTPRSSERLEALARKPFADRRELRLVLAERCRAMETLQGDPAALRKLVGEWDAR